MKSLVWTWNEILRMVLSGPVKTLHPLMCHVGIDYVGDNAAD